MMRNGKIAVVLAILALLFAVNVFAQTPEIEQNMTRLAELRDQMANASPDEYDALKAEFDKLSAETEKLVKEYNADKEAKARAVNLYNEGNDALRRRRFDAAVTAFKQSIELNGMEPRTHYMLGMALQMQRQYNEALEAFDRATRVDPSYVRAFYAQGVLLTRMNQLDEAMSKFRAAISVKNANPRDLSKAYAGMGLVNFKRNKYEDAVRGYDKAVELNPQSDDAWYNLGKAYGELNQYESAVQSIEKAVELDPRNHKYLTALAEKQNRLGKYSEATRTAQAATSIQSNYAAAWFELGWALENLGRKEDAIAAYEKAKNDRTYRQSADYQIKLLKGEF
jgi:tetratricopeptide (TPR) repeat protein